jgi:hypothetical protein
LSGAGLSVRYGTDGANTLIDIEYAVSLGALTQRNHLHRKGQQAIRLLLDHRIALATHLLEPRPVEHPDTSTAVFDYAQPMQLASRLGDSLAAHAQHIGDQFLGHDQIIGWQAIE